jgi:UDP-N-acetyl-D-mannosaminuronic acid dehydrogenase
VAHIVIVGGCGHVGLPLGIALAGVGHHVVLFDIDTAAVDQVRAGKMPFRDEGADEALEAVLATGRLRATMEAAAVADAEHIVTVVGTPVDEYLSPAPHRVVNAVDDLVPHLRDGQHLVLRSTVYPGVTKMIERLLAERGLAIDVSFCPERVAEGHSLVEVRTLPQIVSGRTDRAVERATELFSTLTDTIVPLEVEEAEFAKLFTNTWRYIKFAAANQLFMIANDHGLDYERIRRAVVHDYPRAADLPSAGLAAGPCLLKDTMQLAASDNNNFTLGHSSMLVNEGLPLYLVDRIERRFDLASMTVGILGMAFKAESDDTRSSLSYKLKRLLSLKAREVLCTDPYVRTDPTLSPLEEVLARADLLVIGAPHRAYAALDPAVPVIDIWDRTGRGVLV